MQDLVSHSLRAGPDARTSAAGRAAPCGWHFPTEELAIKAKQEYARANAIDLRHSPLFKHVDLDRLRDRSLAAPFRAICDDRATNLIEAAGAGDDYADFMRGVAVAESPNVWQFRSY